MRLLALWAPSGTSAACTSRSMRSNTGAISAGDIPSTPASRAHCSSTQGGVRSMIIQFTRVEPPTASPCTSPMAASSVVRSAPSAYSASISAGSSSVKSLRRW